MALFRVPFPVDPDRRQALYRTAIEAVSRHGRHEGTLEQGRFEGKTPFGPFAGSYRVLDDSDELEIEITKKPWLVTNHRLEHELRKMISQA